MSRVLFVSTDVVGTYMAGPGIRAWELAHALAKEHTVTLAIPDTSQTHSHTCAIVPYALNQPGTLGELLPKHDVIVGQGFVFATHPELLASNLPLAIDMYDPLIIESLDLYATTELDTAMAHHARCQELTDALLHRGDFFFCATETQRDYWIGALTAIGRVNPTLARMGDRELRTLVDIVPSGIPEAPPIAAHKPVLRGVHPAIGEDDEIYLWAGGLWEWFDPCTIIKAVAHMQPYYPDLRLCFFAGARPTPHGEPFRTSTHQQALALSEELGLLNRSVIFLEEWIPYHERGAYLAEANVGVSAHLPGIETRLAFRTRLLDYLWARLPIICSSGDCLSAEFEEYRIARCAEPEDVQHWRELLSIFYKNRKFQASRAESASYLAEYYTWDYVVEPLSAFCDNPRRMSMPTPSRPDNAAHRIAELEQALDERQAYVRHVEQQYHQAVAQLAEYQHGVRLPYPAKRILEHFRP